MEAVRRWPVEREGAGEFHSPRVRRLFLYSCVWIRGYDGMEKYKRHTVPKGEVDAGADFILTQLFYRGEAREILENCGAAGIMCPIAESCPSKIFGVQGDDTVLQVPGARQVEDEIGRAQGQR